jgi:hypothetical protein
MMPAVHADADHNDQPSLDALPFDQDAGELGVAAEDVIRPFKRQFSRAAPGAIEDRIIRSQCGDERQFGRMVRRRWLVEEKRGVQIAAATSIRCRAAAPRGLLPRRDPERARSRRRAAASASVLVEASVPCAAKRTPAATAAG